MKKMKRIATALVSASVCLMLAGCFSYTRESTPTPAVVTTPPASSSTTTTTSDNGVVQRQHTSTYSYP
jgi:PBP1b-binding outer membrane lipoprotein LpoB